MQGGYLFVHGLKLFAVLLRHPLGPIAKPRQMTEPPRQPHGESLLVALHKEPQSKNTECRD